MRFHCIRMICSALGLMLSSLVLSATPLKDSAWESIAQWPDFYTGLWYAVPDMAVPPGMLGVDPPYRTDMAGIVAAARAGYTNGREPRSAACLPVGVPMVWLYPYPMEILYSPGRVTLAYEQDNQLRTIYLDKAQRPQDPDPSYGGTSIGRWEGDTLVIETDTFASDTEVAMWVPHGPDMRTIERLRLRDVDTLELTISIADADVFTRPWVVTRLFKRHRDWHLKEFVCNENNRQQLDANGIASPDLTPPWLKSSGSIPQPGTRSVK